VGVEITNQTKLTDAFPNLCATALQILCLLDRANWELSVVICDDTFISRLNSQYLNKSGPTNVISFPQTDLTADSTADPEQLLGDVVVSLDTAKREAEQVNRPLDEYLVELLLHGILHLLGYDHELGPSEAEAMEKARDKVWAALAEQSKESE